MQLLLCLECFCMISKGFFLDCRKLHKDLIVVTLSCNSLLVSLMSMVPVQVNKLVHLTSN